jgi:hypothetical protein
MASRSAWAGWIAFAGFILLIVGSVDIVQGFFAILEDEYVVATGKGLAIVDVTAWGWFTLLWGVLLVLAALALFAGQTWARWAAVVLATIGAVAQMGFLANYPQAYPLWNITVLGLQVVVIYALIVRWEEYREQIV